MWEKERMGGCIILDWRERYIGPLKKRKETRERERVVLSIIPFNFLLKNSYFIFRFEFEKETCKRREQCYVVGKN